MNMITKNESITEFMWLDQYNNYHAPAQMSTHHLFYTIKMLWNHFVPEEMKVRPYKQYHLNPKRFTKEYCMRAVRALVKELMTREDRWCYQGQMNQILAALKKGGDTSAKQNVAMVCI